MGKGYNIVGSGLPEIICYPFCDQFVIPIHTYDEETQLPEPTEAGFFFNVRGVTNDVEPFFTPFKLWRYLNKKKTCNTMLGRCLACQIGAGSE